MLFSFTKKCLTEKLFVSEDNKQQIISWNVLKVKCCNSSWKAAVVTAKEHRPYVCELAEPHNSD